MTATDTVNGHDTPVTDIIPAHDGRITLADIPDKYASPDPRLLSKLPKGGINLLFLGHAELTLILTRIDPMWSWEPAGENEDGTPVVRRLDKTWSMWGRLTLLGKTIRCVGTCELNKVEYEKELIGDLLRNGAMRFGIATGLWSKVEAAERDRAYAAEDQEPSTRTERPARSSTSAESKTQRQNTRAKKAADEATDPAAEAEAAALAEARRAPVDEDPGPVPDGESADAGDWFVENGWKNQAEHDQARKETLAAAKRLPEPRREAVKLELQQWEIDPARSFTPGQLGFFRFLIADHAALEAGIDAAVLRAVVLSTTDGNKSRLTPESNPAVADRAVRILGRATYEDLKELWSDTGGLTLVGKDGEIVAKYEPADGEEPF